nr:hypothetical protein [Abalone asfa-like virus]
MSLVNVYKLIIKYGPPDELCDFPRHLILRDFSGLATENTVDQVFCNLLVNDWMHYGYILQDEEDERRHLWAATHINLFNEYLNCASTKQVKRFGYALIRTILTQGKELKKLNELYESCKISKKDCLEFLHLPKIPDPQSWCYLKEHLHYNKKYLPSISEFKNCEAYIYTMDKIYYPSE